MIVQTRRKDESVRIGDNILVTVIEIRGDKVRLGVEVPRDVSVHRGEIMAYLNATQAEQAPASTPPQTIFSSPPEAESTPKPQPLAVSQMEGTLSVPAESTKTVTPSTSQTDPKDNAGAQQEPTRSVRVIKRKIKRLVKKDGTREKIRETILETIRETPAEPKE